MLCSVPEPLGTRNSRTSLTSLRKYLLFAALQPKPLCEVTSEINFRWPCTPMPPYSALPSTVHEYALVHTSTYICMIPYMFPIRNSQICGRLHMVNPCTCVCDKFQGCRRSTYTCTVTHRHCKCGPANIGVFYTIVCMYIYIYIYILSFPLRRLDLSVLFVAATVPRAPVEFSRGVLLHLTSLNCFKGLHKPGA